MSTNLESAALNTKDERPDAEPLKAPDEAYAPTDVADTRAAEDARRNSSDAGVTRADVDSAGIMFRAADSDEPTGQRQSSDSMAGAYVHAAIVTASDINSSGFSARGVRSALEAAGETNVPRGNAVIMGQALAESGKYDQISFDPAQARPGDILVRPWSHSHNMARGGVGYGDIMVITGRNADGSLTGANDHIVNRVPPDGNRYEGSYLLRHKGS